MLLRCIAHSYIYHQYNQLYYFIVLHIYIHKQSFHYHYKQDFYLFPVLVCKEFKL